MKLDAGLARAEPDEEIQDLVARSAGDNLGVDFLPGALGFTPGAGSGFDAAGAADVVWLDALVTNVDRTPRNPNLLLWGRQPWLIDHGAALFRQHGPRGLAATATEPFPNVGDHVLLPQAGPIAEADERLAERAAAAAPAAVAAVPEAFEPDRGALTEFFARRLRAPRAFVGEAEDARRG